MSGLPHSSQNLTQASSFFLNGERGAVTPTSALKLFRIGAKRRLGEVNAYGNSNGKTYSNDKLCKNDEHRPSSSSSFLFLFENPIFSIPLGITELAGPAGVGKTQVALSLCVDCVLYQQNGRDRSRGKDKQQQKKKAVFIQLGGSSRFLRIVSRRLERMLLSRVEATAAVPHNGNSKSCSNKEVIHDCLTRILVHWVCNSEELMEVLKTRLPRLLCIHRATSIVVLDSIANLFRLFPEEHCGTQNPKERSSNPWHDRAVTFFQISNICKELSSRFGVPFVVLNECTSNFSTVHAHHDQRISTMKPALGLAWSQCVNCSYFIQRDSTTISNTTSLPLQDERKIDKRNSLISPNIRNKQEAVNSRNVICLKAPHISSTHPRAKFWINQSGVIPL